MIASGPLPVEVVPLFESPTLSPDAVFITDRHNRIVFWNRSAERILGYTAEEVTGTSCAGALEGCDVYGNRYCSGSCPVNQMAMRNETIRHFDLTLQGKDGHPLTVDVSILNFVVRQPGIFYLAHILKPSRRVEPTRPMVEAGEEPPRSALASVRSSPDSRAHRLTAREVEVLGMLAAGHPTAEIGCGCTSQF